MLDFSAIRCSLMQLGAIFQGSRGLFSESGVFELPLFLWEPKVTLPGRKTNPFSVCWLGGHLGNSPRFVGIGVCWCISFTGISPLFHRNSVGIVVKQLAEFSGHHSDTLEI